MVSTSVDGSAADETETEVEIGFTVTGWVRQLVRLQANVTADELISMLADGRACTTIDDEGHIERIADGQPLAEIVGLKSELDVDDFDIVPEICSPASANHESTESAEAAYRQG